MVGGRRLSATFFLLQKILKLVLSCDIMLSNHPRTGSSMVNGTVEERFALRKIDGANVINSMIQYLSCILICSLKYIFKIYMKYIVEIITPNGSYSASTIIQKKSSNNLG